MRLQGRRNINRSTIVDCGRSWRVALSTRKLASHHERVFQRNRPRAARRDRALDLPIAAVRPIRVSCRGQRKSTGVCARDQTTPPSARGESRRPAPARAPARKHFDQVVEEGADQPGVAQLWPIGGIHDGRFDGFPVREHRHGFTGSMRSSRSRSRP